MSRDIIREQIAYYDAQPPECHNETPRAGPLAAATRRLEALGPLRHVLELAPGAGVWTQELLRIGETITVIDASLEMIGINKRRIADPCVEYRQADLFQWTPDRPYSLVFCAFFLSHVPSDLADVFLRRAGDAVCQGGHLFIVDQCDDLPDYPLPVREGMFEERTLRDGRRFTIVKVYYHPQVLAERITLMGFQVAAERLHPFFYMDALKLTPQGPQR